MRAPVPSWQMTTTAPTTGAGGESEIETIETIFGGREKVNDAEMKRQAQNFAIRHCGSAQALALLWESVARLERRVLELEAKEQKDDVRTKTKR